MAVSPDVGHPQLNPEVNIVFLNKWKTHQKMKRSLNKSTREHKTLTLVISFPCGLLTFIVFGIQGLECWAWMGCGVRGGVVLCGDII